MSAFIPQVFRDGQEYMRTWPMQPQLFALFPECRVIAATKFGIKVMPALAVLTVALQLKLLGMSYMAQALTTGIFFISLPIQGLIWLGLRSKQTLPPAIQAWYSDIHQKMQQHGCALQQRKAKATFNELAALLKVAFADLDRAFTQRWF